MEAGQLLCDLVIRSLNASICAFVENLFEQNANPVKATTP